MGERNGRRRKRKRGDTEKIRRQLEELEKKRKGVKRGRSFDELRF